MATTGPTAIRRRGLEQWAGLGGIAYVVLFIVGAILAFGGQPGLDEDPARVETYFADSGHRDRIWFGWILVMLGAFFLLWFLAGLRQVLRSLDPGGFWTNLASIGGLVYATLTIASISLSSAIKTMSDDTYQDTVYPELIHAADDAGYVLHAAGGVGAGAMMIAASLAAARAGVIPAWLGWIGTAAGIIALGSIVFFPQFLIALWLLAAGALLFVARPRTDAGPIGGDPR